MRGSTAQGQRVVDGWDAPVCGMTWGWGVEMFCIGWEMVRADSQEEHWRALVTEVRAVYDGLITSNCDKYQKGHVTWWDAVDVISASGVYPTGEWEAQVDRIEEVVRPE